MSSEVLKQRRVLILSIITVGKTLQAQGMDMGSRKGVVDMLWGVFDLRPLQLTPVAPRIWTLELPQEFEFTSIKDGVFRLSDSVGFEFLVPNAVGFRTVEAYVPNYWGAEADLEALIRELEGVETIVSLGKEKVPASFSHSFLLVKLIVPAHRMDMALARAPSRWCSYCRRRLDLSQGSNPGTLLRSSARTRR
jgi:hypothetical protein